MSINEYEKMAKKTAAFSCEMSKIAELKETLNEKIIQEIEASMSKCEAQMKAIIKEDEEIRERFELITSVEGVGLLTGVYLIVATNNFKTITKARKLACHIGIAPFQKVSGSSIRVNKGVLHFCDKVGKKMITNAVGCAIRRYGGLRTYYERKVSEGIPEAKVLNACKNKLLHRIFAVVKSGVPYDRFHVWQPNSQ